ncbi:glycosyltransferase family 39 protein [Streptomyces sp. NBC_01142]|uniref:ArnT family glycosyltransferase n=1 Tax=Streptomyces sp. NBC_01142 TaxID=2975865 RepID=UPI00224F5FBF|nr:glycosyltransferase family 39 protein [Streptomyces sp. NBC_01142]MCX4824197.1 glycosyltransferase family 39 protein [Streptomyces sp. NBC_01142]
MTPARDDHAYPPPAQPPGTDVLMTGPAPGSSGHGGPHEALRPAGHTEGHTAGHAAGDAAGDAAGGRTVRLWRGRQEDARWVRPAFLALLLATALLYLYNLSASGYANSFYSAAAQAGSESWKAFFFGSSDAANSITVDKPPAALWPMALSVRLFGLGSWQILLPEVLMGVATVGVLHAAVRRRFTPAAGLIAGAVLALTPVAALMFRFNNPDALLALLMTVTVYCVLRALDGARTTWLVWAGVAVGFAFLTKTLQAFLILPPLALVYAVCAPTPLRRRLGQLALSGLAMILAGGWWVAVVELWPAASRPYIGGSQTNSFLELTFGYNGLGRINGNETGSVGGGGGGGRGGGGGGGWGESGIDRMFSGNIGGQISWLLPAALLLLVAGLVLTWRAGRTDTARAAFLVWGGSLLMTAGIFSFMAGIFHEYYTVALAPYIAALVGMGGTVLWEERTKLLGSAALGGTVAVTAVWSYVLLGRSADYLPWLRWAVLIGGLAAAAGLLLASRVGRRLALGAAALGLAASLAGPLAYSLTTVGEGHAGSIVTAGPAVASGRGGPGGGPGGGGGDGGFAGRMQPPGQQGQNQQGQNQQGQNQQGQNQRGQNQRDGGMPAGGPGQPPTGSLMPGGDGLGERGAGGGGGGMGGLLNGASVGSAVKAELTQNAGAYTWVAAAIGSQNAASYQLATGKPVMAIGGFNGSDPSPTLAQFKQYVTDGKIHYFIAGGGRGGGPGGNSSSGITTWVEATFTKVTVDGATLYDLTGRK